MSPAIEALRQGAKPPAVRIATFLGRMGRMTAPPPPMAQARKRSGHHDHERMPSSGLESESPAERNVMGATYAQHPLSVPSVSRLITAFTNGLFQFRFRPVQIFAKC